MKRIKLTERQEAAFGPRATKPVGSRAWCWQTLDLLRDQFQRIEMDWGRAAETVKELRAAKAWDVVPPNRPYGSEDAMLLAEIGLTAKQARREISLQEQRAANATEADKKDKANVRPTGVHIQKEDVNTKGRPWGNSAAAAIRRLRKDRPDIHERVLAGEITPHAGMIEAGFRKRRVRKKATPLDRLNRAWNAASDDERGAFMRGKGLIER
jgi:hypothetical protein